MVVLHFLIAGLFLGLLAFMGILMICSWFKYGFSDKWGMIHFFVDHWKGCLICYGVLVIVIPIIMLICGYKF